MEAKKIILVSGPSESGKSGGIIYLLNKFSDHLCHIKIRDIFFDLYKKSKSVMPIDDWRKEESKNLEFLWSEFINEVYARNNKEIVILDTMYGINDLKAIYKILGDKLILLYIDAPEKERALREFNRLRSDSPYSERKADLSVTYEQIFEKTKKKDKRKFVDGVFEYPNICVTDKNRLTLKQVGRRFAVVINNDSTEELFHLKLEKFISSVL